MKYKNDGIPRGKVLQFPSQANQPEEVEEVSPKQEVNFGMFALAVIGGQVEIAGKILEQLLHLEPEEAIRAAKHYSDTYQVDKGIQAKAMHIRTLIQCNQNNDALLAIYECFGLQGIPGIKVLESMRAMIS